MRRWNRTNERLNNKSGETESHTNSKEIELLLKFDGHMVAQVA